MRPRTSAACCGETWRSPVSDFNRALLPGLTVGPQGLDNDPRLVVVELQRVRHGPLLLDGILGISPR
jgi:hypothetical protein